MAMEPCLHQGNIYTKRKLRVWRAQKCIPLVGAIATLTCAGRKSTPSRRKQCRAQNGKLGKLGRTYGHGTVFAPTKYLHQKEATGMERPEMYSVIRFNNPTLPVRAVKIPRLEGGSKGPRKERCVNWDGPYSMVLCLQQGNIYTKRKLRVWRDQKCIPLVGAITPFTCAAVKIPRLEGGSVGDRMESWVNWDGPLAMEPCLHQGIFTPKGSYGYGETRNVLR